MNRNWIARYYNWADDIIGEERFYDRSEQEAFLPGELSMDEWIPQYRKAKQHDHCPDG